MTATDIAGQHLKTKIWQYLWKTLNPVPGSTVFVWRNACLASWTLLQNVTHVCFHCKACTAFMAPNVLTWHSLFDFQQTLTSSSKNLMSWSECNPFLHFYLFYYQVTLTFKEGRYWNLSKNGQFLQFDFFFFLIYDILRL